MAAMRRDDLIPTGSMARLHGNRPWLIFSWPMFRGQIYCQMFVQKTTLVIMNRKTTTPELLAKLYTRIQATDYVSVGHFTTDYPQI
jgi:hypothetical protein